MNNVADIEFVSAYDGSEQRYLLWTPDGVRSSDAMIVLHGHGADCWQYVNEPRGECSGVRAVAMRYGMLFVAPEYRGKSWMNSAAEVDIAQIIASLRARRVFLVGGSMGGTAALIFAALHPELIAGVAAANPMANMVEYDAFLEQNARLDIREAIHRAYGGSCDEVPAEYQRRSPELHAERLTMPVAITCGGRDDVVPPDSVRRLAERLKRLGRRVLLIDRPEGDHSTNEEDTVASIEFVVRASPNKF